MIVTKKIIKIVTQYNLKIFKKFGYKMGDIAEVDINDWDIKSHEKILVSCDVCGLEKILPIREYYASYNKYEKYCCSSSCAYFKNKETKKILYGDENYQNLEKTKNTCKEKYGVDNPFKSDLIKERIKQTSLKNWGYEFPQLHEEIKEKTKRTCLKIWGVDNPSKSELVKNKKKETSIKNFGVEHPFQCQEMKEKIKTTNLKLYGVEYPIQCEQIKEKIKKTNLVKYGCEYFTLSEAYKEAFKINKGVEINSPIDIINIWKNTEDYKNRKESIYQKIRITNMKKGNWFKPVEYIYEFGEYRKLVLRITKQNGKLLWDGYDYYDSEFIFDYYNLNSNHRYYPTIDHKISIKFGFDNNISPYLIGSIENLCYTKRYINSKKSSKTESEFKLII